MSGANANLGLQAAGALYTFVGMLCQFMSKSPSSIAEVRWRTRVCMRVHVLVYMTCTCAAGPPSCMGMAGGGTLPSVFSSAEYRAWMRRAPSTSALYERVGRLTHQPSHGFPPSATASLGRPLPRVAHSAESLLDSLRQVGLFPLP